MKEHLLCLQEKLKQYKNNLDGLDIVIRNSYREIFENPKLETEENYQQEIFTGYASIDKPHLKYFKKEILDAKFPKMKMYDYLYLRNINRQNFTALNYFGRKITYNEMFSHINDVAKSFKQMGVKKGEHHLMLLLVLVI